jgi:glycosyltransferase involved in cell wall biosynthesis
MARTKIILITDAWDPQVNGVVTTYKNIIENLPADVIVDVIHPGLFKGFNFPFYKEIKISFCSFGRMWDILYTYTLNANKQGYNVYYHIATEGLLGLCAKRVLDKQSKTYTTAYHTKFPEFIEQMYKVPVKFTKWYFDWFHKKSKFVFCSSESNAKENCHWNSVVLDKGYSNIFKFKKQSPSFEKILLYVGRVSKEKNLEEFCKIDILHTRKVIVGQGPALKNLKEKYPEVEFVGYKFGEDLVNYYQTADVFVFPSKVDTFGNVILEAMACGTPVAGYPVTGPIDQIQNGVNGYFNDDLEFAAEMCLNLDRKEVYNTVKHKSWQKSAQTFIDYITK